MCLSCVTPSPCPSRRLRQPHPPQSPPTKPSPSRSCDMRSEDYDVRTVLVTSKVSHQGIEVGGCEERSDELRRYIYGTPTSNADTSVHNVAQITPGCLLLLASLVTRVYAVLCRFDPRLVFRSSRDSHLSSTPSNSSPNPPSSNDWIASSSSLNDF